MTSRKKKRFVMPQRRIVVVLPPPPSLGELNANIEALYGAKTQEETTVVKLKPKRVKKQAAKATTKKTKKASKKKGGSGKSGVSATAAQDWTAVDDGKLRKVMDSDDYTEQKCSDLFLPVALSLTVADGLNFSGIIWVLRCVVFFLFCYPSR